MSDNTRKPLHFVIKGWDEQGLPCFMHEYERDHNYTLADVASLTGKILRAHPKIVRFRLDAAIADNISPIG